MADKTDVLVTLSTFAAHSKVPLKLLEQSGLTFQINPLGRRMKPEEVVGLGRDCRGLVAGVEEYSAKTLSQLPRLRCISRCGAGIDNIDLDAARQREIEILNTPDEPCAAVAELTLALMLALLRELPKVNLLMHERQWKRVPGRLLKGKTVAVVGLGRIGQRVTQLLQALGVKVVGVDPKLDRAWADARGIELLPLEAALKRAEIVSIHASSSEEHPLCFGTQELGRMKPGTWLINTARGDLLDDRALDEALRSGHLSGAGLDVYFEEPYDGPLCSNDRVILSPHQATLTVETRVAMETRAVENLLNCLKGGS